MLIPIKAPMIREPYQIKDNQKPQLEKQKEIPPFFFLIQYKQ